MTHDPNLAAGNDDEPRVLSPGEHICPVCGGEGRISDGVTERACPSCDGAGIVVDGGV